MAFFYQTFNMFIATACHIVGEKYIDEWKNTRSTFQQAELFRKEKRDSFATMLSKNQTSK